VSREAPREARIMGQTASCTSLQPDDPSLEHEPHERRRQRFPCNPTELCCSEPCREDTATVAWAAVEAVLPQTKNTDEEILQRVLDPIQAHKDQLQQGTDYTFSERSSSFSEDEMSASSSNNKATIYLQTTTPEMKRPRPPGVPPLAIPARVAAMANSGRTAKFGRSPTGSIDGTLCLSTSCCGDHAMAQLDEEIPTFVSCRQWDTAMQSPQSLYSEELQAPEKFEEVASCQEFSEGLAARGRMSAAFRREQPPLCREPSAEPPTEPPAEPLAQPFICKEFSSPTVEASPEKVPLEPTPALAPVGVRKGKLGGA